MLRCPKCKSNLIQIIAPVNLTLRQNEKGTFGVDRQVVEYCIKSRHLEEGSSTTCEAMFELNRDPEMLVICDSAMCDGKRYKLQDCISQEEKIMEKSW